MTFGDTLLAALVGALVGGVVGASARGYFALDLRRRESHQAQGVRLDAAVAEVVRLLGEYRGAVQAIYLS